MLHSLTIASGKTQVVLPNGRAYDAGETAILTEAQYARVDQDLVGDLFTYDGAVPDNEVTTQGANVPAPAALTSSAPAALTAAASAAAPTKVEFDKVVADNVALHATLTAVQADLAALRTKVAALITALTGAGKPLSAGGL